MGDPPSFRAAQDEALDDEVLPEKDPRWAAFAASRRGLRKRSQVRCQYSRVGARLSHIE